MIHSCLFFFHGTAPTEIYTLSLHDALPISAHAVRAASARVRGPRQPAPGGRRPRAGIRREAADRLEQAGEGRSEEHTSELQSLAYLVCRLLLEKKKKQT